jgi:hypothetical protein
MAVAAHSRKPSFRPFETWGACSRCGARVRYSTLRRERLTGLLMCSDASGRPVSPCWDPWPEVFDFQVKPDRSIEPPAEPLPARWNLDAIWGNGPEQGTTSDFANAPAAAPDDATRLANLVATVPYYALLGKNPGISYDGPTLREQVQTATTIVPADYDGTFLPSSSIRTVTPPADPSSAVNMTDHDLLTAQLWGPPLSAAKGV